MEKLVYTGNVVLWLWLSFTYYKYIISIPSDNLPSVCMYVVYVYILHVCTMEIEPAWPARIRFFWSYYPFLYFLLFFAWFYFNGVYMRVGIIMNPFNRLFLCIKRPFTIGDSNQHVGHLGPILILGYKNQSCFALNIHCIVANFKKIQIQSEGEKRE